MGFLNLHERRPPPCKSENQAPFPAAKTGYCSRLKRVKRMKQDYWLIVEEESFFLG
jgi:hypothetical protein